MRRLRYLTLALVGALAACGATTPRRTATVTTTFTAPPPRAGATTSDGHSPLTVTLAFERRVSGDVQGLAFEHGRLYVNVAGTLRVFDEHGPVAGVRHAWKGGEPLVVVGDGAFDPISFASHAPAVRAGLSCATRSFSLDGARMSADCTDSTGAEAVYVYDTRSGAELGVFKEIETAGARRSGEITDSGHFVLWRSRASGALESIGSHELGRVYSSRSTLSPDDTMLFTTVDRDFRPDDDSPATMVDPASGRTLFELPRDVDFVFFAPSGHLFAARHSASWAGGGDARRDRAFLTLHDGGPAILARIPAETAASQPTKDDAVSAAFAPDGSAIVVDFGAGLVAVYAIRRG